MRALIDMGASVSLIEEHRYKSLKNLGWLRKPDMEISQVDRKPMRMRQMVIPPNEKRRDKENPQFLYNTKSLEM